jgi:type IV secretory pathway VirB2 component (pilin)
MDFHLPKPLGWREFVGEVGIIVLGVLIALGAGQVVEYFTSARSCARRNRR